MVVGFPSLRFPEHALWIASLDDFKPKLLAKREDSAKIRQYSWSPDSQQIAYVDGRMVRLISVMTKEATSYTTVSPFMSDPVFDPEGNLVIVANTDLIGNPTALEGDVEKVRATTPKDSPYLLVVGRNRKSYTTEEQLQLTGDKIVVPYIFRPKSEVYLRIEGVDRKITPPLIPGTTNPRCLDVLLSPDRKKVLIHCIGTKSQLSVYEIRTKRRWDLDVIAMPGSWSPDSEYVLFRLEISDGHVVFWNDLYITHYTGGRRVKIARAKGTAHGAFWSKDGLIAYEEQGKIIIGRIDLR